MQEKAVGDGGESDEDAETDRYDNSISNVREYFLYNLFFSHTYIFTNYDMKFSPS